MVVKTWWLFKCGSLGYEVRDGYVISNDKGSSGFMAPAKKIEFVIMAHYFRGIKDITNRDITKSDYPAWLESLENSGLIINSTLNKYAQRLTEEEAQKILGYLSLIESYDTSDYYFTIYDACKKMGIKWER